MKKCSLILILLILFISMGAFAQTFSMSIGVGGLFDWNLNSGVEIKTGGATAYDKIHNMSFGGFLFFDATYAEISACFGYGLIANVYDNGVSKGRVQAGSLMQVSAGILLKYPLDLGRITFFPLLGAEYNMVFVSKDKDGNKVPDNVSDTLKNFSQFGLLGGAGIDIFLKKGLFLRVETLYQIRFAGKATRDAADAAAGPGISAYSTLGMGPLVKVGVGYKF